MLHPCRFQAQLADWFTLAIVVAMAPVTLLAARVPVSVKLQINRIAGSPSGVPGGPVDTGPALLSLLNQPEGVSIDGGGNLYIADTGDHLVRFVRVDTGVITTVAGNPAIAPFEPSNIGDGGPATLAALDSPMALALDAKGNLYVADAGDSRVREISASTGIISTVAGTGVSGYTDDNVAATKAELNHPSGVAVDLAGNLYISDSGNNLIREVNHSSGTITTIAGVVGASGGYNGDNVAATQATLNFPAGIAVDFSGQVYFSDRDNSRIRRIDKAGIISTIAGNGTTGFGGDGNLASLAEINFPVGITLDHEGNLYVADSGNNALRIVSKGLNFPATEIGSSSPPTHTMFIQMNAAAVLSTPAIPASQVQPDSAAGTPLQEFSVGNITACTADGNTLNQADSVCAVPITFTPQYPGLRTGTMHLTANSDSISVGLYGTGLGPQAIVTPGVIQTILDSADSSGGIALTAPQRIAVDPAGNLYVADPGGNVVWGWQNRAGATFTILAGGGTLPAAQANGGPATDAALKQPGAVALDAAGNLYIAETGANLVRKVNLATGIISTVAGTGTPGYSGDTGAATCATLNAPKGIAANAVGDLIIADTGNNVIRRVYARGGVIVTIAGTGNAGYSGDGGDALHAELQHPQSVTLDSTGRLFIADTGNNVIRAVDAVTQSISTIAGNGTAGLSGDGGPA
jgi:trimeric autotransporter adhesin